jgi:hypothetical protein
MAAPRTSSELSISDVACIQIRKAFCAAQIGFSDFIRYFAAVNGIEGWFDAFRNSVSGDQRARLVDADSSTWVGDMCVITTYAARTLDLTIFG